MTSRSGCVDVFLSCDKAIRQGILIRRSNKQDKEYHFQNWFSQRFAELGILFDPPSRNTYPDFRLVDPPEGFEVKALAYPGREADYDANSQVPTGFHNGRSIFYVFGRYPRDPDAEDYPVIDLVMCHGDFLNADRSYIHENKHIRGFGSYGDIMIRDRKMYVAPTPFALTDGTTGQRTLILPDKWEKDPRLRPAGHLVRTEAAKMLVGYSLELRQNTLSANYVANPHAGTEHHFVAYRAGATKAPPVALKKVPLPDEP